MRLSYFISAFLFVLMPVWCFAGDDFAVNIHVDVTAADAAAAREKAHQGAQAAAVTAAAKRLTDAAGVEKIAALNHNQLINFVKETSVSDEKTPVNRYIADLHIVVNMDLLKTYMRERSIDIAPELIPNILLVPVFKPSPAETPILWEINNAWRKIWDEYDIKSGVNFAVIKDNQPNIETISALSAFELDNAALSELKELNHVDDVYVLSASFDSIDTLNVEISSLSGYRDTVQTAGVKSESDEMFRQAIEQIIPLIEQQAYQQKDAFAAPIQEKMTVLYPFADLSDWVAAESKIKNIPEIASLEVQALSPGKVQFVIGYTSSADELTSALASFGYGLEDGGNYMILKYIGD
ncbi:MAG: hypothetical protein IJ184_04975 [Alphaproteobacteria bacterium]|nr:hypothetical protein [Alphaproteobacteria bacterium]